MFFGASSVLFRKDHDVEPLLSTNLRSILQSLNLGYILGDSLLLELFRSNRCEKFFEGEVCLYNNNQ